MTPEENRIAAQKELEDDQRELGITVTVLDELMVVHSRTLGLRFLCWKTDRFAQYAHLVMILKEVFVKRPYDYYSVQDKTVVDVGAYLGETAIRFMGMGAKNVICYEPYKSGALIEANCVLNEIKKVKVVRAAISASRGRHFNPGLFNHGTTEFEETGGEGRTMTLEDIAAKDAVLKLDCEGAEHEILSTASNATIRKFSAIMMEAHERIDDLVQRLVECGFNIDGVENVWNKTWMIYAIRVD